MLEGHLRYVFSQFKSDVALSSFKELATGHINDTYLIKTKTKPYYVLQRINAGVFNNVPGLIENKVAVSHHIHKKLRNTPKKTQEYQALIYVKTKTGASYFQSDDGSFWNMMLFIDDSVTFEKAANEKIAYEGGQILGEFLTLTNDFDPSSLIEVIPKFHDMAFRYSQFENACLSASKARLNQSKQYIEKVIALKDEMHILQKLKEKGRLKIRVTHNDTKISNILFNAYDEGLCVIDLDTVMPGIVHYDYGDAVRTICSTALEDERNLDLVSFNLSYYEAYSEGFLTKMKPFLSALELKLLPLGAKTMTFIMGLRFLTDYLNGDVYYKIKYPQHNFDRAKNQFKLLDSMCQKMEQLKKMEWVNI